MDEPRFAKGDTVLQRLLYERGRRMEGEVVGEAAQRSDHPKPGWWYQVKWSAAAETCWAHGDVLLVIREALTPV